MKTNNNYRNLTIISEIYPQHYGSMNEIKRMIIQSKIGGADIVKLQLYDSKKLWGDNRRKYLDVTKDELAEINEFCKFQGIELSASIFDLERVDWCTELNFKTYKIASRSVEDKELCEKILSLGKRTIVSLGMYDYQKNGIPFDENENISYLYCVAKYPTPLYEIKMPDFNKSFFTGYSDHTIGISACLYAVSRGATILEKHFSNSKAMNVETSPGHSGSMNLNDLMQIRELSDNLRLLNYDKTE
jgi:sialic acid synthase SpsE